LRFPTSAVPHAPPPMTPTYTPTTVTQRSSWKTHFSAEDWTIIHFAYSKRRTYVFRFRSSQS